MLIALSAACAVMVVASMGVMVTVDYGNTIREAENRNTVFAQFIEAHARHSFDIAKGALSDLSASVVSDDGLRVTPETAGRMDRWLAEMPEIYSFWVIDDRGGLVFTTLKTVTGRYDFSDRAYFRAHAAGEDLHIGAMTRGKIDKLWFFSLSKRLTDSSGRFRGLLLASMPADYFSVIYRKLDLGPNDTIAIFKTDGSTVIRRRHDWDGDVAPSNAASRLFREFFPKSPVGSFHATSPIDHVDRLVAYRAVEGWPLVAVSGLEWDRVLLPWQVRAIQQALYCLAVLAAIGALTIWTHRRVRSEELALAKNGILLNEVHHRVKNNLAIVQSLLTMELNRCSPEVSETYRDSIARIEAMGLVHHLLYEFQTFEGIEAADYLRRLCDGLQSTAGDIRIEVDAETMEVTLDQAVPMALIANEIITNAIKHAYPQGQPGDIAVKLRRSAGSAELTVLDHGRGLPPDAGEGGTLGLLLIRLLTRQIDGALSLANEGGARFTVTFPLADKA